MTDICLPMPTAEEARATFGKDFDPDGTLNGAIALAAAGDRRPSCCANEGGLRLPRCRSQVAGSNDRANRRTFELHLCCACFHSYSAQ